MTIKNIECHNNNEVHLIEYDDIKHKTVGDVSKFFTRNKTDVLVITKRKKPFYVLTSTDIIDALVAHLDDIEISIYIDKNPKETYHKFCV